MEFAVPGSEIQVHASFESFDEFYEEYKRWAEHGHHPFTVDKSHAAKEAKGSAETGWVDRIKYVRVRYACVHRGTPIYRGQGKRPNQTYMGKNCKAHLSIKCDKNIEFHNTAGDKLKGKIVVSEINEDHNHEISADLFKVYRQNRVLGTDELKRAKQLLGDKAGADVVAKTLSEMSGKVVSKKDVYNLGSKLRAGEDGKHSRRHYREDSVPASMAPTVSLLPEFQDEIVIDQESVEEVESSKSKSRKRKMEEDSGMQSVLESALADVTAPKSAVLTMQTIENDDADPTDVTTVEITSSSSSGAPLPAAVVSRELSALPAAKHMRCTPVTPPTLCVNPLGVKMNLPRMHEEAAAEVVTYEAGDLTFMAKVGFPVPKAVSSIRPGQCVYVKTDSGATAISRSITTEFSMPRIAGSARKIGKPKRQELVRKSAEETREELKRQTFLNGAIRLAPARLLNLMAQVCRTWHEQITEALATRQRPSFIMEHIFLVKDSRMEDLLPQLESNVSRLAFEPRFVLSFTSTALFRPQFGFPSDPLNAISAFKELLPKRSVLCEIYGVGLIGTSYHGPARTITQARECIAVGGTAALVLPEMRHATPVCLVLDAKRLRELENADSIPLYIEQALGPSRPPLKSLLLFEHGAPSHRALQKFHHYVLDSHQRGFACAGVDVCQSKVDAAVYTSEHQWGPTVVAIGFLGDCVIATSLYLTAAECADPVVVQARLQEWRNTLSASTFCPTVGYNLAHFCFVFYSDKDQRTGLPLDENLNPNTLFVKCFPDVNLLGVQANGSVYGYSLDMAHVTDDVRQSARAMLDKKSEYACTFCIVSLPHLS